jgi:hypothetical protein
MTPTGHQPGWRDSVPRSRLGGGQSTCRCTRCSA